MRMELEFGKWLLDVAKYMLTALILANFFGDMDSLGTISFVTILMLVMLVSGLWLVRDYTDKDSTKVKKKGKR